MYQFLQWGWNIDDTTAKTRTSIYDAANFLATIIFIDLYLYIYLLFSDGWRGKIIITLKKILKKSKAKVSCLRILI